MRVQALLCSVARGNRLGTGTASIFPLNSLVSKACMIASHIWQWVGPQWLHNVHSGNTTFAVAVHTIIALKAWMNEWSLLDWTSIQETRHSARSVTTHIYNWSPPYSTVRWADWNCPQGLLPTSRVKHGTPTGCGCSPKGRNQPTHHSARGRDLKYIHKRNNSTKTWKYINTVTSIIQ